MTFKNCPPVLVSYFRYLEVVRNYSRNTVLAKQSDIRGFLQFLQARNLPSDHPVELSGVYVADMDTAVIAAVTADDVEEYVEYLLNTKVSERTIRERKLTSLRTFYDYLIRNREELGISIGANPVMDGTPGVTSADPARVLSYTELKHLLDSIDGQTAVRDTAIVLLLATTGITLSQLVSIRCEDYREDTLLVAGRTVYLTERCQEALNTYLQECRDPISDSIHDNAIFVSDNYRKRLTPRCVQKALQKHFDRAGIQATAKDLRHTAVVEILKTARNDCELAYIAGCLGYSDPKFLRQFTIQKKNSADAPINMVEQTWLNDLGGKYA